MIVHPVKYKRLRYWKLLTLVAAFIFLLLQLPVYSPVSAASLSGNDQIVPQVIGNVSPSVVGIVGNQKEDSNTSPNYKYTEQIIHGTGVIIKSNGEILTNAHVVKDMDRIIVILSDGNGYEGTLKCIDEETDLATVQIQKSKLPIAGLAEEKDIVIGKTVIAIGNPISLSLRNSASIGIVSGINRGMNSAYRLIQTDAAINPGNSGGPLVNLEGKVIGINSSKFIGSGIEGMGFSIPVQTVKYVLEHFDKYGKVNRPYLGAQFEEGWAAALGLPNPEGIKIVGLEEGAPAKTQGLKEGDCLLEINKVKISGIVDFNEEMKKYMPGSRVQLKIKRDGSIRQIDITLGDKKAE